MISESEDGPQRAAIRPVKERIEDELLAREGIVGVDIAEKITDGEATGELSIVVFVEKKKPASRLKKADAVPAEIEGIRTDVQEVEVELQVGAAHLEEVDALVDTDRYPTLVGGISMGPARSIFLSPPDVPTAGNYTFSGTFGAVVRDRGSGAPMALTNFHVACVDTGWNVGDRMVQPSRPDGGATPADEYGALARAVLSEDVDGAVIRLDDDRQWLPRVTEIGDVAGGTAAAVGMVVQKRGRTTEHTHGTVISTDATISLDFGNGIGSRTLRRQIRIETDTSRSARFSNGGDSGSVIMTTDRHVVGLLFAGSTDGRFTFANPLQAVLDQLSVDLEVPRRVPLTRPVDCWTTRVTITCPGLRTREPICKPLVTRTTISCLGITRPHLYCPTPITRDPLRCPPLFTRSPDLCLQITRDPGCLVTRVGCPEPTRAVCGPGDWNNPPDGPFAGHGYGDAPTEGVDGDFWAGYLTALEEVAATYDEPDDQLEDGGGAGGGTGR